MSDWQNLQIEDICEYVISGGTPLTSNKAYYQGGSIPWIKTKEVNQNRIYTSENFITQLGIENSAAKLVPINTVIVAMYGDGKTAGRVALAKIPLSTNQACCNLIVDSKKADAEFIFYNLQSRYEELVFRKTGSGQQNLSSKIIKSLDLYLPPLHEQQAIAGVLSALDDKIDLLQRQNQTLEQMAATLFRQWFIEEVKEDWEVKSLTKIANFTNGLACQKFPSKLGNKSLPVLKIKELTAGLSENSDRVSLEVDEKFIVNSGDIIFAWSASLMVKIWFGEKCVLNQHLFNVKSDQYPKWFYYEWCKYYLEEFISISQSHATTMGHIKRSDLDNAMVKIPKVTELNEMSEIMIPILDRRIINNNSIQTYKSLRDTLLPKLISGEVRLKGFAEKVEGLQDVS